MKKMSYVLLVLICLFSAGCAKKTSPAKPFSQFGISFTCPSGWEIDADEAMDESGYYQISVEKTGLNSSGIMSMVDGKRNGFD